MQRAFANSRRSRLLCGALLALILTVYAAPQRTFAQKTKPTGSVVIGHVTCADTNAPARFAQVSLHPMREESGETNPSAPNGSTTGTGGEFRIEDVPPGRYLVFVELAGYISGVSLLNEDQRKHLESISNPSSEGLTVIDVANGQPVAVDVELERGASVSGTILYDDGSPAAGLSVSVLRKAASDQPAQPVYQSTSQLFPFPGTRGFLGLTDSEGHFRVEGLPEGTYILRAQAISASKTTSLSGRTSRFFERPNAQLEVFNGNVFWEQNAKPFHLAEGDVSVMELMIPLTKLHTIDGTLVSASSSSPLNLGRIRLIPKTQQGDDQVSDGRYTRVDDDGRFVFFNVPESDYLVRVDGAGETTSAPESIDTTPETVRVAHAYGDLELPLHVDGNVHGLKLAVPEKAPAQQPVQ